MVAGPLRERVEAQASGSPQLQGRPVRWGVGVEGEEELPTETGKPSNEERGFPVIGQPLGVSGWD